MPDPLQMPTTEATIDVDSFRARLPMPILPTDPEQSLAAKDPDLYAAWRKHIEQGFENNQTMFRRVLDGFMYPYWLTVGMYLALFLVGIISFVVAIVLAFRSANTEAGANSSVIFGSSAIFGGLTVLSFLSYFLSRPLQALEENLQFITWLGMLYNSYWTRLAYALNLATMQQDVEAITNDAILKLNALLDKHSTLSGKRPNTSTDEVRTNKEKY